MSEEPQESSAVPDPPKRSKLIFLIIGLVVVCGTAGAATVWLRHRPKPHTVEPPPVLSLVHLETFVVNLADDEHTYLRIGIDLGVLPDEKPTKEEAKDKGGESKIPVIRDTALALLAQSHSSDLATIEGRQKLKDDLVRDLNQRVPGLRVREIYITEFLIQR